MVDIVADALNTIKTHEYAGKKKCSVKASKLIERILFILKNNNYIKDYKFIENGKGNLFEIELDGKINEIGVIKPRFPVKKNEWPKYEQIYLPAYNVGLLIVSTSKGVMTNLEAQNLGIGGRLIAYVY